MSTFLLEIGTEELPADFARFVTIQLDELVRTDLNQRRLSHGKLVCTSTPRRIALVVDALADVATSCDEVHKGPPANKAFVDGSPTKAAFGFANRLGVEVEELEIRETSKGPFVFANAIKKGEPAIQLLSELIPNWIAGLQGRRFMRWGTSERRFSRPVRWLIALLDQEVIPIRIDDTDPLIVSGNTSRGHRLYADKILVSSANEYFSLLSEGGVHVDRSSRFLLIKDLIDQAALALNAYPDLTDNLLDELTDLVESPSLIEGDIDDLFLDLPAEVLSTVMRVHQRYVPLYKLDAENNPLALQARNILLPKFLCICNSLCASKEIVRRGNERVLRARLSDAKFFISEDLTVNSDNRRTKLDRVTFSVGLGSLLDRVKRIEWLVEALIDQLKIQKPIDYYARRSAYFCKHDLVSQMVGEFPELQGVMGGKYLLAEGEPNQVALAVLEQYLPRGAGDNCPESDAGAILALAERFETLLSIFSKGERPSGSSDPYALRRAGNGIIQIIWAKGWHLDLFHLVKNAVIHWSNILGELNFDSLELADDLCSFLRLRIITLLEEIGIEVDIVQAVAGETNSIVRILSDPLDSKSRAQLISSLRISGKLLSVQEVVLRATRLADKGDLKADILSPHNVVNPDLFEKSSEFGMHKILALLDPIASGSSIDRYSKLVEGLIAGSDALDAFFDGEESVMVMVDDPKVRKNRLNLLGILRNQAKVICDFSKIQG